MKLTELKNKIIDYLSFECALKEIFKDIKSKEPRITIKKSGFNLDKTDLTENDSNKLFSAKGALNLLNSLNTNITNTFNTLKDILKKEIIAKQNKIDDALITINKEIVPAINEIYNKYKCSYRVGDILITTDNQHPALTWIGTTWIKLEGRFLLGTSGNTNAGEIGGVSSISLSIENIPQHRHKVDPHFHTQPSHTHGYIRSRGGNGRFASIDSYNLSGTHQTNSAGGESTGTAAPFTDYQGNGKAFNILPPFIKVHFWKRLS